MKLYNRTWKPVHPFLLNKKHLFMSRPKGSQNKITTEVKEKLQNLIDTVVNRVDVDAMTTKQKVQLFIFVFFAKLLP